MPFCIRDDVKVYVAPKTISDEEIDAIIQQSSDVIVLTTGCASDSTDTRIRQACIHLSVAQLLRKMKFSGELAAQIKMGSESQNNNIDTEIQYHSAASAEFMRKYTGIRSGIPYGRVGIRTINSED